MPTLHDSDPDLEPVTTIGTSEVLGPRRILVIEDDTTMAEAIARILSRAGHQVERAYNGVRGIRIAQESRPDVITLDLRMPALDGEDVCRILRADPRTRDVPILVISNVPEDEVGPTLLRLGADDFLDKWFEPADLLDRVARIVH